jgi:hypothetical protein
VKKSKLGPGLKTNMRDYGLMVAIIQSAAGVMYCNMGALVREIITGDLLMIIKRKQRNLRNFTILQTSS